MGVALKSSGEGATGRGGGLLPLGVELMDTLDPLKVADAVHVLDQHDLVNVVNGAACVGCLWGECPPSV